MKKGYSDITFILDRSGSMRAIMGDTIGGFNTFVEAQRNTGAQVTFTLVEFDSFHTSMCYAVDISKVPPLDLMNYTPAGSTALYDAVGFMIDDTGKRLSALPEEERPEKVLFVILTDGEENASSKYTLKQIAERIKHQREKYNWEFVFLGANQDAILTAKELSIPMSNSMTFDYSSLGTKEAFQSVARNAAAYLAGASLNVGFSSEDRKVQEKLLKDTIV